MIPIIIFHLGNQDYLKLAIDQALSFNNLVYLIGDENNKHFCENHYDWTQFVNSDFVNIYKHISPNNYPFEKICIERWIIIFNFMKVLNIEKAFICDSDVLVYCNVDNIINNFYKDDLYISTTNTFYRVTAGQSIWSLTQLELFIQFIYDFYQNNDWEYIENYWSSYNDKIYGGISDMYLVYCFLTGTNFKNNHFNPDLTILKKDYDLSQIRYNCFFDNSIDNDSDAFKINRWQQKKYDFNVANMKNSIKDFTFKNGLPYCLNLNTNMENRVYSIHFHGCKSLMSQFATFSNIINPTISSVVFSLNDNFTSDNKERFIISINSMTDCVDEVVYIDWGSPNGVSLLEDPDVFPHIKSKSKIKHLKFSRKEIDAIIPKKTFFIQHSIIRNIGTRNATGEYIIHTNIDIIFPEREKLLNIIQNGNKNTFYTINRKDVDMNMVRAIYDVNKNQLGTILEKYIELRRNPNDLDPETNFKQEALEQLQDQESLYNCYVRYSKIWNCGDFQIAHRDIWHTIRGFEENMTETAYCTDSNVQRKVCNYGYYLKPVNFPHVYHMSHTHRSNNKNKMNDLNRYFINFTISENNDNWGIINKTNKKKLLWISDYNYSGYSMVANCLIPYIIDKFDLYFFVINCNNYSEKVKNIVNNDLHIEKEKIFINESDNDDYYNSLIGINSLKKLLESINPDYLFTLNDYQVITSQVEHIINECKFWNGKKIAYMPIDSENYRKHFLDKLNYFDLIFTMTEKSKNIIQNTGIQKKILVLPHPINNNFKPLQNKLEIRKKWFNNQINDDDIVIINNNNNSIRKKLDLSIESFYILHSKKNSNTKNYYLLLKTSCIQSDNINKGININKFIEEMNEKYKTDLTHKIIINTNKYSCEELNELYNCCDIYISSTSGEGWGLTAFEALQCELYTLVPDNTSYSEYFRNNELLIKTNEKTIAETRNNINVPQSKIDGYIFIKGYNKNNYNINFVENIIHDNKISQKNIYQIKFDNSLHAQFTYFKNISPKPDSFEMFISVDSPSFLYTQKFVEELFELNLKDYFGEYHINIIPFTNFDWFITKNKIIVIDDLVDKIIYYSENKMKCLENIRFYKNEILNNLDNEYIGKLFLKYISIHI